MYVSQGYITISGGDAAYQWRCEEPGLTSRHDKLVGASAFPQQSLSANILTTKDSGIFILTCLTRRIHQVNSISLTGPCFAVWCTMKPGDQC